MSDATIAPIEPILGSDSLKSLDCIIAILVVDFAEDITELAHRSSREHIGIGRIEWPIIACVHLDFPRCRNDDLLHSNVLNGNFSGTTGSRGRHLLVLGMGQ